MTQILRPDGGKFKQMTSSSQQPKKNHADFIQSRQPAIYRQEIKALRGLQTGLGHLNAQMELLCMDRLEKIRKRVGVLEKRLEKIAALQIQQVSQDIRMLVPVAKSTERYDALQRLVESGELMKQSISARKQQICETEESIQKIRGERQKLGQQLHAYREAKGALTELQQTRAQQKLSLENWHKSKTLLVQIRQKTEDLAQTRADVGVGQQTMSQLVYQLCDYQTGAHYKKAVARKCSLDAEFCNLQLHQVSGDLKLATQQLRAQQLRDTQCVATCPPSFERCIEAVESLMQQDFADYKAAVEFLKQ